MKITNDIIDSYLHCRYKAYLKINEKEGLKTDYELLQKELRQRNLLKFHEQINKLKLSEEFLSQGIEYIINPTIECNNGWSIEIDILERTIIKGDQTKYTHSPILITVNEKPTTADRLLLSCVSYLLKDSQITITEHAKIIFGQNLQSEKVKIGRYLKKAERIVKDINSNEPDLTLNNHCPICEYREFCKDRAKANDNISLLNKGTPKIIDKYKKKGIFTIKQLSYLYKPRRRKRQRVNQVISHNIELQALAIREDKIYVQRLPELFRQPVELFLDIEGNPAQKLYYLIGIGVFQNGKYKYSSFWADDADNENRIWMQFLAFLNEYSGIPIYHYGSYEAKAISILGKRYDADVSNIENRLINISNSIYAKIYFPVYSNGLKEIGNYIGAIWTSPNASGIQSLVWRHKWNETFDEGYKQQLITYNSEDCAALKLLTDKLSSIQESANVSSDIEFAANPKKSTTEISAKIHQEFNVILKSAHENYETSKISFQNLGQDTLGVKKAGAQMGHKGKSRSFLKTRNVVSVPIKRTCPLCKCKLTKHTRTTERTITDMVFTKNAIRKVVIKYIGYKSYCSMCYRYFKPPQIQKISNKHFGFNFRVWVVYQRLFLRLPFEVIRSNLKELFNADIGRGGINVLFNSFASFYKYTENQSIKQILNSPFIHVDETKINVKGADYYVWIFTNGKEVIFRETETREINMVYEFLKDFTGILISDFYPGFDSLKCTHQKCWVHLIRDINEDLWKNPFDIEYEKFVVGLRNLIIPIFEVMAKYGSKKRHFNKFHKNIDKFYNNVILKEENSSELVSKYRKRLKKHWGDLFTFLEFDNIPWNNNLAERGLRHLAVQRKISTYFDKGLSSYLIFLGIMQTCRFQKKSFLKFLLSGKKNI